jgi:hypothetical protein
MRLLIMQFSSLSYYFNPLRSKYSQHPVFRYSQSAYKYVLPLMSEAKFHTHTNHKQNCSSVRFDLYVSSLQARRELQIQNHRHCRFAKPENQVLIKPVI